MTTVVCEKKIVSMLFVRFVQRLTFRRNEINKESQSRYSRCPDGRRASEIIVIPCKIALVLVLKF
jgi:hypothetical protein